MRSGIDGRSSVGNKGVKKDVKRRKKLDAEKVRRC